MFFGVLETARIYAGESDFCPADGADLLFRRLGLTGQLLEEFAGLQLLYLRHGEILLGILMNRFTAIVC